MALVEEAFRLRDVITTLPGAEVSARDLALLKPTTWLNDEVINFYGVMVNIRSAAAKARRDKGKAQMLEGDEELLDVHVFSSHFYSKLADSGYSGVRKWSKKVRAMLENVYHLTDPNRIPLSCLPSSTSSAKISSSCLSTSETCTGYAQPSISRQSASSTMTRWEG